MTDRQHPITTPLALVEKWRNQAPEGQGSQIRELWLTTQAARWGADQELEACCEWLVAHDWKAVHKYLRIARRPRPPSLKEQALAVIENSEICDHLSPDHAAILRRALETLPND